MVAAYNFINQSADKLKDDAGHKHSHWTEAEVTPRSLDFMYMCVFFIFFLFGVGGLKLCRGIKVFSQPVYCTGLFILKAEKVLVYLLLQLPCSVSMSVCVCIRRRWGLSGSMDICLQL